MLLFLQIVVYCVLFLAIVKCAVRNSGLNCLYFYPAEYIEEAEKRGIADKEATMKKGKKFMVPFCIFIFGILIPVIAFWNHVTDFKTAYIQAFLFLFVKYHTDYISKMLCELHCLFCWDFADEISGIFFSDIYKHTIDLIVITKSNICI